jgi:hypothetical protein
MTIKIFFVLFATVVILTDAKGQIAIGLEAGISNNFLHTDISKLSYTNNQSENGFIITVLVQYVINNTLFLKTAFTLLQKNHSYIRTGPYTGVYTRFTNSYGQLPVMAGINFGNKKIKALLQAGVYGAYWLQGKMKGQIPNIYNVTDSISSNGQITENYALAGFNQRYAFDSRKDRRFECGVTGGLGLTYFLNTRNSVLIEANYSHSLTSQQKNYMMNQEKRLNKTLAITAGYLYRFNTRSSKTGTR